MKRTMGMATVAALTAAMFATLGVALATDDKAITLAVVDRTTVPAVTHDTVRDYVLIVDTKAEAVFVTWWRGRMVAGAFVAKFRESERLVNVTDADGNPVVGQQYYDDALAALGLSDQAASNANLHALLAPMIKAKRIVAKSAGAEVIK